MYTQFVKNLCLAAYALHVLTLALHRDALEEIIEDAQEQLITTMSIMRKAKGNRLSHL